MVGTKSWPAWWYGPGGEGQPFTAASDVPKGWVDHPSKLPPVEEKPGGEDAAEAELLRAENEQLRERVEVLSLERDTLLDDVSRTAAEVNKLRRALAAQQAPPNVGGSAQQPESPSARRPRKLSAAEPPSVTAGDETITLDEGRAERLRVLREAGIQISDDATDGDIEEALDWLAKQPAKD